MVGTKKIVLFGIPVLASILILGTLGLSQNVFASEPPVKEIEVENEAAMIMMQSMNEQLEEMGLNVAVEEIEFFTIGKERPSARIHQLPTQWVPSDDRRFADGNNITYLVDQSEGTSTSGLTSAETEAAIDRAMSTWDENMCLTKVDIAKRTDTGLDPDIFDSFVGFGGFGNPFLADITHAGWLPKAFFDNFGVGGGDQILAISITFVFLGVNGEPTDIDGNNYLDVALNEVYYNDNFDWEIDTDLPSIDVETVALHESGHSLGLGHFGPQPKAVMNPIYAGIQHEASPTDQAGMCTVWASWPNP